MLDPAYVHARYADPDAKTSDVALAITAAIVEVYGRDRIEALSLDSGVVREAIARRLVAQLEAAGYRVTFTGRAR